MSETQPVSMEEVWQSQIRQIKEKLDERELYQLGYQVHSHPWVEPEAGENYMFSDILSLVYGNRVGPLVWFRQRLFRPIGISTEAAPRLTLGALVLDRESDPGNQMRIVTYRPGQLRTVHRLSSAVDNRTLPSLLPYPTAYANLADPAQMELYPDMVNTPGEVDFQRTVNEMFRDAGTFHFRYPYLIPPDLEAGVPP